ncbi:methyltransferase domain-containing protein [Kitasatospora phosalacinea]|uniref:methyltransferase domain-containing protein n=1 Tax=Kitasatospora phosalacinea TaxID=2065 RepID=UPI00068FAABA|nr:methyltransferase domain-containing protein [Kitasatospora phosalacinea]
MTTTHQHEHPNQHPHPVRHHDVLIVGGGAAGLSGALTLARARRSVLVVDSGRPRNAPAEGIHGLLGREGLPPAELVALGRAEVASYGGEFHDAEVRSVSREADGGFRAELSDGGAVHARRLLLTTGTTDLLPEVPGLAERWGRQVVHCPYCHGWEVRDRKIAVLATDPAIAVHQALLWRQWSADVTLLAHTGGSFDERQRRELAARGVSVVPGEVVALLPENENESEDKDENGGAGLTGVRLADGTVVACEALAVGTEMAATAPFLADLGLEATDLVREGVRFATRLATTDPVGATGVPGVWAAGNLTDPAGQVAIAAADGLRAAAAINADLVAEETRLAVEAVEFWEKRYGESEQIWSGRPNASLTVQAAGLEPGHALDVGCGEGGDAIWLAGQGWRVTAVDISQVALERAAARAAVENVADRIDWQRVDLAHAFPAGSYDLVSAQFLHSPAEFPRDRVLRRAAAAVAPGGTLLITSHAAPPVKHDHPHPEMNFPTPGEMLASLRLDPSVWTVELAEEHARHDHPGHPVTDPDARPHRDSTLRLRRAA